MTFTAYQWQMQKCGIFQTAKVPVLYMQMKGERGGGGVGGEEREGDRVWEKDGRKQRGGLRGRHVEKEKEGE